MLERPTSCKDRLLKVQLRSVTDKHKVLGGAISKTSLFKHIENFTIKTLKFSDKNSGSFHISAQNIDCGTR